MAVWYQVYSGLQKKKTQCPKNVKFVNDFKVQNYPLADQSDIAQKMAWKIEKKKQFINGTIFWYYLARCSALESSGAAAVATARNHAYNSYSQGNMSSRYLYFTRVHYFWQMNTLTKTKSSFVKKKIITPCTKFGPKSGSFYYMYVCNFLFARTFFIPRHNNFQ